MPKVIIINQGYGPAAAALLESHGYAVRLVSKTRTGDVADLLSCDTSRGASPPHKPLAQVLLHRLQHALNTWVIE